jgi:hypothetical protein
MVASQCEVIYRELPGLTGSVLRRRSGPLSEPRSGVAARNNPGARSGYGRIRRPAHKYTPADFGLIEDDVAARFAP